MALAPKRAPILRRDSPIAVKLGGLLDLRLIKAGIATLRDRPIDVFRHSCRVDAKALRQFVNMGSSLARVLEAP